MTTTHFIAKTNTVTGCDITTREVHERADLVSVFSEDVDCPNCLAKIKEMAALGFYPKY